MKRAALVLLAALLPAVASAQQSLSPSTGRGPLRELSLEELGSLEVTTVSKQPAEVWRTPAAITVLTQDDIRRSGVTTLPELLRLVNGVQVSRLDSDHWALGIRGLTSSFSKALLVLIDGRSVYTPLFGGVYWQVQETLLEDIERVEVIRGPGGTIWGSNAFNGVINVITKSSRDTAGPLVSLGGGNVDQGRVGLRYGGSHGDALSYRVYGSGALHDAEHHTDGHPFDVWRLAQAGFRVDATRRAGETFRVQGDVYKGSAGERVAVSSFFPPAGFLVEGSDRVSGGNILARWELERPGGAGVRLQAYYDRTVRHAVHFGEERNTVDVDFLQHTPIGPRHQLSWGAGARNSTSDITQVFSTLTLTPEDRSQRLASLFAQDEIAIVPDRVWLTLGTKLEHNTYSGWEIQPSARVLWRPGPRETVWTSVARAVRTPSRIETDLDFTVFAVASPLIYAQLAGSQTFDAESLVSVEVGYRRLVGSTFYVDVTGFHNHYDGLSGFSPFAITVEPAPIAHVQFKETYQNAIEAASDGVEISPDWRPVSWVRLKGAYALLTIDAKDRPGYTDTANVLLYEGSIPRHQGSLQASVTLPGRIELDYAQRAVGRLASHKIPRYVTADARLGWEAVRGVTAAISAQNLFAPNHLEFFRDEFPNIGIRRSVYASLTWRR